jgi:hypothetical protein
MPGRGFLVSGKRTFSFRTAELMLKEDGFSPDQSASFNGDGGKNESDGA